MTIKVALHREYLTRDGYSKRGQYFGIGAPVYSVAAVDGTIETHIRAQNREDAKEQVRSIASRRGLQVSFYC